MIVSNSSVEDLFSKAIDCQQKGNFSEAKLIYEKIIKINSKFPNVYYNLGNIFKELGEYKKAINCYKKVIEIDPQNVSAINNLGVLYKDAENFKKAILYLKKSLILTINILVHILI